jgi:diguanylate cyclase (GGDEF)-like protein
VKILIAEDDLISRRLLQKILQDWGHEVIIAENGREAWELFQKKEVKFIIADWLMPVMDGLELCRKIRLSNSPGYVYFILLTGKDKKEDLIKGFDAGVDDYVVKPLDRDELRVRLRTGERILKLEKELMDKNEELHRLNDRLEKMALKDPLMEIGNRRGFYELIKKVHHRACRYMQGYGIIMCDIDDFKSYNDTYGHLEGDKVLKIIAETIKNSFRLSDDIFRYGGEEIVIVLQGQGIEGTITVAERLREKIESLQIENKGSRRGIITISCGVAAFSKDDVHSKWEVILNRADRALYNAKLAGKNRVGLPEEHITTH